jgi:hypothetical protein
MRTCMVLLRWSVLVSITLAACPYANPAALAGRADQVQSSPQFMNQFSLDDSNGFLTSDVGSPMSDQASLKAGPRGSTLLEDFILRQKITHFDHERVISTSDAETATLNNTLTRHSSRCQNEQCMPGVRVHMGHSQATETGQISRRHLF